ncbi:MAG TPA: glycosyltransferase family 2 protein [Pyrinomonadaceae bacterium]|nr:glycosyltransferase family 2 protein [Pyrinomonadaceae bacterium]
MKLSNSSATDLSVIIPWSNRPELELTLASNRAEFESTGAEVLVVNCGGDGRLLAVAVENSGCRNVRRAFIPAPKFNKCLAQNLGAHLSRGRVVFLLDSDIILDKGFLKEALMQVSAETCATVARVVEKEGRAGQQLSSYLVRMVQTTEFACRDGRVIRFEHERVYFEDGSEAGPGLVVLRKEDFRAVGGMNSKLECWGYEDLDLHLRLNAVCGLKMKHVGRATHLTHGDDKRNLTGTNKIASHKLNVAICYDNYARGNFMGTYAADVAEWAARVSEADGMPAADTVVAEELAVGA